jgi:hypothetical protein
MPEDSNAKTVERCPQENRIADVSTISVKHSDVKPGIIKGFDRCSYHQLGGYAGELENNAETRIRLKWLELG